jgi:hypothetical protein
MQQLYAEVVTHLNPPIGTYRRGVARLLWGGLQQNGPGFLWLGLLGGIRSAFVDDRKQVYFPNRRRRADSARALASASKSAYRSDGGDIRQREA